MKTAIYKYEVGQGFNTMMPSGAEILKFGMQKNKPMVWAKVRLEEAPLSKRRLRVVGTGATLNGEYKYHGTCFDGPWVWHLIEEEGLAE